MKKYLPIVISLLLVLVVAFVTIWQKNSTVVEKEKVNDIGTFSKQQSCAKHPNFLNKLKIPQPIAIDLSQQQHKGLVFLYGQGLGKAVHLKTWEKFDHFSTYALDPKGNMYLTPMPYISVKENTFEFQKSIYKLDTNSGKLSVWMSLDEVRAGGNNPYGVISLDYDCDDHTLWVSAIDETDYDTNRGVIYHIDVKSKKVLQRIEGVDALTVRLLHSSQGKYLLYGSARQSGLFALKIEDSMLAANSIQLVELSNANEHIRKIKVRANNTLELQTIPFSYSLIAQTSRGEDRKFYGLSWDTSSSSWELSSK
ncbi:MAG: Unknown protein [uncultured Sulfurovum sp.]|uniref:Uncharacterized protein n=1 Tax=uncultured Sulfurovum sp. TaxID=269237 RepID=A0A6S6SYB1_9BACT|nr:MAG: Unknown protein [uncultured Sulfurovum sp.]